MTFICKFPHLNGAARFIYYPFNNSTSNKQPDLHVTLLDYTDIVDYFSMSSVWFPPRIFMKCTEKNKVQRQVRLLSRRCAAQMVQSECASSGSHENYSFFSFPFFKYIYTLVYHQSSLTCCVTQTCFSSSINCFLKLYAKCQNNLRMDRLGFEEKHKFEIVFYFGGGSINETFLQIWYQGACHFVDVVALQHPYTFTDGRRTTHHARSGDKTNKQTKQTTKREQIKNKNWFIVD